MLCYYFFVTLKSWHLLVIQDTTIDTSKDKPKKPKESLEKPVVPVKPPKPVKMPSVPEVMKAKETVAWLMLFFLDSWIPANWKKIKNTHCYVLFCILS